MNIIRTALLMIICAGIAHAQNPVPSSEAPGKGLATVYVYLAAGGDWTWPFSMNLPVYYGDGGKRKIANLRRNRYFMLRLPTGKHAFDTRAMVGVLEVDLKAGQEYYPRLVIGECEDPPSPAAHSTPQPAS